MDKKCIVFLDSGAGGISTLASCLKIVNTRVLYFADNKFAPYGSLTKNQIRARLEKLIIDLISKYKTDCIILACNTATTTSIAYLRQQFPAITFIGTEPAILLSKKYGYKTPLIIATPQTVSQLKSNPKFFTQTCKLVAVKNFANHIEQFLCKSTCFNYFLLLKDIYYIKSKLKTSDCIVLGCTHYVLIKDLIKKHIALPTIDGNQGVAKQISRKIGVSQQLSTKYFDITFKFSDESNDLKQNYKKILKQILANPTKLC